MGAAAPKAPGTYKEEMNCLSFRMRGEGAGFAQTEVLAEAAVTLLCLHLT